MPHTVRAALALELAPAPGDPGTAVGILMTNLRLALFILLAGRVRRRASLMRTVLDAAVTLLVAGNTILVGAAFGAYGQAAVPWLVHLPIEWAGLIVLVRAYLSARRPSGPEMGWRSPAAHVVALLSIGAAIETYLTPQ
jgi:hypothetical protein